MLRLISKPRVLFLIATAATLSVATMGLFALLYADPAFDHHHRLVVCCVPFVVILSVGAYLLARGSRLGRAVLAFVFVVLLLSLSMLSAFSILALGAPPASLKIPLAAVVLLLAPSYLLLFSRRLGGELDVIRTARA